MWGKKVRNCVNCRSGIFLITKSRECPFSTDLLAFVRIFTAPLNILEKLLQEKEALCNFKDTHLHVEDLKALEFLENRYWSIIIIGCAVWYIIFGRCSLLLTLYQTSISEDEKFLESMSLSPCSRQATLMRLCEKKILVDAVNYAKHKLEEFTKQIAPTK